MSFFLSIKIYRQATADAAIPIPTYLTVYKPENQDLSQALKFSGTTSDPRKVRKSKTTTANDELLRHGSGNDDVSFRIHIST